MALDAMGSAGRSRVARWQPVVAFWLLLTLLYDGQIWWLAHMPGERINVRQAIAWQSTYYLAWIPFTILVWRITSDWLPESAGGWPRLILAHVPLFAAVAMSHLFIVAIAAMQFAAEPTSLWNAFMMQLRGRLHLQLLIYTAIAGAGTALRLHERYRDRQLAAVQLQAELTAARLDALRGHLQPHFLFNSLHSIASLARTGDTAGVVRLTAALSDILRHVLDSGDRHLSLADEMQLVERYLDIQRVRFADRLDVKVDVAPDAAGARVPGLIVQPLVENALRHGLGPRVAPGLLTVRAVREDGWTRIDVEDTGVGLPAGWSIESCRGTGLRNLSSRLSAEFGDRASIDVQPRHDGGVRATVRLPFVAS
jgi:two-component system LytT family sensor kinase